MQDKIIKNKNPQKINLETGKDYFWCACGLSKDGIFCDGSHKNTNLQPVKFTVPETKPYFLCGCKNTNNKPFCDGAHSKA
jgi:CDGSH-type Zn-finger protein